MPPEGEFGGVHQAAPARNLVVSRSETNAWDRMERQHQRSVIVRIAAAAAAAGLFLYARRRNQPLLRTLGLLGATALTRAALGDDRVSQAATRLTGISPARRERRGEVDEASADSFPASDPPASSPGRAGH